MIFFLVTSRNVFLILDILENAGTSKCFILVSFQLHKCISEKEKNLELIGTVFQVKILINLQSFLNYLRMLIYPKLLLYIIFK